MLSSLMRNKTGPLLVAFQIAVTLAIVINSLFIIVQRVEKMNRNPGIDVNNVIVVYARGFGESFDVEDSVRNDIELIKSIPGVVAASVTNQVPLSGSGSGTGLRTVPKEEIQPVSTARYQWSEEGLDALGVVLTGGRNFYPQEVHYERPESDSPVVASVLITQELADELFPDGDALGKPVYWGSMESSTVVGIIGHMHGSWVNWDKLGKRSAMTATSTRPPASFPRTALLTPSSSSRSRVAPCSSPIPPASSSNSTRRWTSARICCGATTSTRVAIHSGSIISMSLHLKFKTPSISMPGSAFG
jgi:hypothetical protein